MHFNCNRISFIAIRVSESTNSVLLFCALQRCDLYLAGEVHMHCTAVELSRPCTVSEVGQPLPLSLWIVVWLDLWRTEFILFRSRTLWLCDLIQSVQLCLAAAWKVESGVSLRRASNINFRTRWRSAREIFERAARSVTCLINPQWGGHLIIEWEWMRRWRWKWNNRTRMRSNEMTTINM